VQSYSLPGTHSEDFGGGVARKFDWNLRILSQVGEIAKGIFKLANALLHFYSMLSSQVAFRFNFCTNRCTSLDAINRC
jgi:hypothetical protein